MANNIIKIEVYGTNDLISKIKKLSDFLQGQAFKGVLEDAGQDYVNRAKHDAPISRSPGATGLVHGGALRNSINYRIEEFGTPQVVIRVGAGGPGAGYAKYVEQGSGPSMRVPINKKMMFWMEDGAGRTVNIPWGGAPLSGWSTHFRSFVWHPGTRAQPFFFKHVPDVSRRLVAAIERAIQDEFNKQKP